AEAPREETAAWQPEGGEHRRDPEAVHEAERERDQRPEPYRLAAPREQPEVAAREEREPREHRHGHGPHAERGGERQGGEHRGREPRRGAVAPAEEPHVLGRDQRDR